MFEPWFQIERTIGVPYQTSLYPPPSPSHPHPLLPTSPTNPRQYQHPPPPSSPSASNPPPRSPFLLRASLAPSYFPHSMARVRTLPRSRNRCGWRALRCQFRFARSREFDRGIAVVRLMLMLKLGVEVLFYLVQLLFPLLQNAFSALQSTFSAL